MRGIVILVFVALLVVVPPALAAQSQGDMWRAFAEQLDVGAELTVRLRDGQRFRATLIAVRDEALLVQPKTRVPVPVQPVPYDVIAALERRSVGGLSAGKAAAIGVASGAATFVAMLLVLLATID